MNTSDFDFELPHELIAQYPAARREESRMMLLERDTGNHRIGAFTDIEQYLEAGDCLVLNDTKVVQARLYGKRVPTGGHVEAFILEQQGGPLCQALLKPGRRLPPGEYVKLDGADEGFTVVCKNEDGTFQIQFDRPDVPDILERFGSIPLPPYIDRRPEAEDKERYQTVYASNPGAVAAPTAGLHFTTELLERLQAHGVEIARLTLHVGAGTFKPVKSEEMEGHEMHTEFISVRRQTIAKLLNHDCQAIAVGTTSVRTLESLYYMGLKVIANPNLTEDQLHVSQWEPYETSHAETAVAALEALASWMDARGLEVLHSSTQIIICPGYDYKIVRMLVTNFHQPQSTLLLLVSAFVGGDWHKIYDYALAHDFRFLSYGDSSLLIP